MSNNFTYKFKSGAEVTLKSTEDATVTPAVHTMHVSVDDLAMDGLGATDDDVVGAGEEGSVSAKLRRISADINELLTLMPEEGAEAEAQELLNLYLQELDNRMTDGAQVAQILGKISDDTFRVPRLDPSTHAFKTISYAHSEIHGRNGFVCHYSQTVSDTNDRSIIAFKTPDSDKLLHAIVAASVTATAVAYIWEAPTITDNTGASLTIYNRYRDTGAGPLKASGVIDTSQNPDVAGQAMYFTEATMGSVTGGTELAHILLGAGAGPKVIGGSARDSQEWVLKRNTLYAFEIISSTADDNMHWLELDWYEHTAKD